MVIERNLTVQFCRRLCIFVGFLASGAIASAQPVPRQGDWHQFLGPGRNGVSPAKGLLDAWPQGGPKELWRVPGGVGMSGLAIAGSHLCTLVQKEGQQWLVALDSLTGEQRWQTALAPEYKNAQGDGPRATPTITDIPGLPDKTVVAYTGQGVLCVLNLENGALLWHRDVVKEHGGKVADYGMASSPWVMGDNVVVIAGAPQACVVSYHRKSGQLNWKAGDDPAGYSSPTALELRNRWQPVVFTGASVMGIAGGKVLWRYPYETDYDCNIAVPLAVDGKVLISSGENHGTVLLELEPADGDRFVPREVWKSQGPQSVLRSEWQTPILLDGKLYGLDNIGSAGPVTHLTCIDAATGKRLWQQPRFGKSNMIAADGKLFFSTMAGELVVVRTNPERYEEIGRKQVLGATRQAPSLAGGLLYMRDDKEIVCLDVRK